MDFQKNRLCAEKWRENRRKMARKSPKNGAKIAEQS
jgi:hypothetical protein